MSVELDVHRELAELAGHARQYADATAVLRVARQRRQRRYLASAGACAAMVLAVAVGANLLARPPGESEPGPVAATSPALPSVIDPPAGTAPALPTDHGVGRAGLLYEPSLGGPAILVTEDGSQYRVPFLSASDGLYAEPFYQMPAKLSPDGRWLAIVSGAGTTVRDLTSNAVLRLGAYDMPVAWSPDSRWLVHTHDDEAVLLDLQTGQSYASIRTYGSSVPTADFKVITVNFRYDGRVSLAWFDPVSGTESRRTFVDAGNALGPQESLVWTSASLQGPDGEAQCVATGAGWASLLNEGRVLLGVFGEPHGGTCLEEVGRQVAYAVVDVASGRVTNRLELPAGAGDPFWYGGDVAYPFRDASGRIAIRLVGADGHDVGQLTSLPAAAVFFFAGATITGAGPGNA